jgi:cobalt-precorrin 5A hydrolase/precorrin-3B C17-methyltransferase
MSLSQFQSFEPIAAIATTPQAAQQLYPLCASLNAVLHVPPALSHLKGTQVYTDPLKTHIADLWQTHQTLIFGLASGAVVRLIAPLLEHKSVDPAVVVIDQQGKFVISLCSGHQGKADQLTRLLAQQLGATPVLTGAANALEFIGIDQLGVAWGWQPGPGDWTKVSAAFARHASIQVIQEAGSTLWQTTLPSEHPLKFTSVDTSVEAVEARIWISSKQRKWDEQAAIPEIQWHPRVLWLGVGCERHTPRNVIETAIQQALQTQNLAPSAIAGIATLDIKADEAGLVELCQDQNWPLRTFTPAELQAIAVPHPSEVVRQAVGTPSVAEAAALKAANVEQLQVTKQIYRVPSDSPKTGQAVTIAIAEAKQEYIGKVGQLWLVGTGPGQLSQITPAAQTAVTQADVVIGYSLYLDLIAPLRRPGQVIESYPITQERQRCERAISLAQWGLTVAVVSSGDCGIYGMAGLVLEQLRALGWDGKTPQVEVFPGISAVQSAASRVGAPLMHDFCTISLSDLLTPWEVIKQRLIAAAEADFVCALYNPRSRTRTEPFIQAQAIFLKYRSPQTPVALVHSAYREDEQITLTTLEKLDQVSVDMLTTVLIGNQTTQYYKDWMITPRGYNAAPGNLQEDKEENQL